VSCIDSSYLRAIPTGTGGSYLGDQPEDSYWTTLDPIRRPDRRTWRNCPGHELAGEETEHWEVNSVASTDKWTPYFERVATGLLSFFNFDSKAWSQSWSLVICS